MNFRQVGLVSLGLVTAANAIAADWGGKEVLASSHFGMKKFAAAQGEKVFALVTGVAVKLTDKKDASKVRISFTDGEKKTKDYDVAEGDIAGAEAYSAPRAAEEDWGGKEVQTSSDAALKHFLEKKGKANFLSVSGIIVAVNTGKNATNVKITYQDGGDEKTQKYFCHLHDVEIDCH